MSEPDHTQTESVSISRRLLDTAVLATLFLATLAVGGTVVFLFAKDFIAEPAMFSALVLGLGTPVLLGGVLYVAVYWSRVASVAEFGDAIDLRTPLRRRRYRWDELGRLELHEQSPPIPGRCVAKMVFTDHSCFTVFADRQQGEALLRLAEAAPWARDWPGAPLPATAALAFAGLGVVAVALGVLILCDPVADVLENGFADNRSGIHAEDAKGLAIAATVVPLAGLAGIGVGVYHLVRRPVVTRPGVVRVRPGDPPVRPELL